MILKSYIVEQNAEILRKYQATLLYGENIGIKEDIKGEIIKNNKNSEIFTFFENDILKSNILYDNFANQSLFNSKKIIFIQEVTDKIFNQITECLEKENKQIQIYLFADNLEKKSKIRSLFEKANNLAVFPCYEDTEQTLISYINKELKDLKGLTGELVNFIINNSNKDRKIIKSEITKIKDFFIDKKINKKDIEGILNLKIDSEFNQIRDKALLGEKENINKLLSETEILNEEGFFYLNALNYRITHLLEIIKLSDKTNYRETIEKFKPAIFWKDKTIILQQLMKWSQKKLEEMTFKIGETEILMKKYSFLKNDVIIKNLIINLTKKAATS